MLEVSQSVRQSAIYSVAVHSVRFSPKYSSAKLFFFLLLVPFFIFILLCFSAFIVFGINKRQTNIISLALQNGQIFFAFLFILWLIKSIFKCFYVFVLFSALSFFSIITIIICSTSVLLSYTITDRSYYYFVSFFLFF